MATALGVNHSTYLHMASLDGFGDLRTYTVSGRVASTALSSYTPGGMFGRLNSPAGLDLRGIASSGLIQPGHPQNLSNSFNPPGKLQQSVPASQTSNLFQGIPTSLELNQLQQNKCTAHIGVFNAINNPTCFTFPTSFPDTRVNVGSSSNAMSSASGNHLMLQGNPQQTLGRVASGNLGLASSNPESYDLGISGSSNFLDHNRCSESWKGAVQLSKFPSNALPISVPFDHGRLHSSNSGISSSSPQIGNNPHDFSSTSAPLGPLEEPRGDVQCEEGLFGNIVQPINYTQKQRWEEHKQDYNHYLYQTYGASNSLVSTNRNLSPFSQSLDQSNAVCSKKVDASLIDQLNGGTSSALHSMVVEESAMDNKMKPNENYSLDPPKLQDGLIQNSYGSLDDIMNSMWKRV